MTLREACETVITLDDLDKCECDYTSLGLTGPEVNAILDDACNALARITHLPVGRCTIPYRPCRVGCTSWACNCCGPIGIPLPGINPTVQSVKIDGAVVPSSEYAVVRTANQFMLERLDASGYPALWPHTQNVALADTLAGTFAVYVTAGLYPDEIMRSAAGEIACDIISHLNTQRETPEGAVAATGYGVSLDYRRFGDPTDQETQNLAGLSWLRRFVAANGGARPAAIWSPELDNGWTLYRRQ